MDKNYVNLKVNKQCGKVSFFCTEKDELLTSYIQPKNLFFHILTTLITITKFIKKI